MSFNSFSQDDVNRARYRFSGYNLPKLTLDETGASYVKLPPHPGNFQGIPSWWGQRAIDFEPASYWDSDMCWFNRIPGPIAWRESVAYFGNPAQVIPEMLPIMTS